MAKAVIVGTGIYVPGAPIDNKTVMKLTGIEFDAARHEQKIGIKQRHISRLSGLQETTADFAEKAARDALKAAKIDAEDVGLFIVATDTPEHISPATSIIVQGRLQGGQTYAKSFDLGASCASFVEALDVAARNLITDTSVHYALVIGVYNMPAFIRDDDSFGWSIFADGAGAVVLERQEESNSGYIDGTFITDGTQWNFLGVYAGGTRFPITHERLNKGEYGLQLLQKMPGDRNIRLWPPLIQHLLDKVHLPQSEVDHYLFTQINKSVIEQVMEILGEPIEKTTMVMDRYGYTGSGCIPMAMHVGLQEGRIKKGDLVVLVASGAGLAVGASLLRI